MLTAGEWWAIINQYGAAIWPLPVIFNVFAFCVTIGFLFKPGRLADGVIKLYFFIAFLWAVSFPPLLQIPKCGAYEDSVLFVVGLYSIYLSLKYSRNIKRTGLISQ